MHMIKARYNETTVGSSFLSAHPALGVLAGLSGLECLSQKLREKLDPESLIPAKEIREMRKCDERHQFARRNYLTSKILTNAVQDLITDFQIRLAEDPGVIAAEETKARDSLLS